MNEIFTVVAEKKTEPNELNDNCKAHNMIPRGI